MDIIMEFGGDSNGVGLPFELGLEDHGKIIGVQDPMNKDQTGA